METGTLPYFDEIGEHPLFGGYNPLCPDSDRVATHKNTAEDIFIIALSAWF